MKTTAIALATILFGALAARAEAGNGDNNSCIHSTGICLKIGEKKSFKKVRTIIGYKVVTQMQTEVRFRDETRSRMTTKYRNETRFRNITKYRTVTRYRNEWRNRTIRSWKTKPVCVQVGTNGCGQPVYRTVYRKVPCKTTQRYKVSIPYKAREAYTVREAYCARVPYQAKEFYTVRISYKAQVPVKKRIPVYGIKRVTVIQPVFTCGQG